MTTRRALYSMMILALVAWVGLLLFTRLVAPRAVAALLTFFMLLAVALISSFAFLAYILVRRILNPYGYKTSIRAALRQGTLLALVVMLNLCLSALNSWNLLTALALLVAALIVEVLCLARK